MTTSMLALPMKVDAADRYSSARYSAWNVPYPMRDTTLIGTPFYHVTPIFEWVVKARESRFTDIVLTATNPEVAEAVAVAMVLDLTRQPGGALPLLSGSVLCAPANDVHEDRDDLKRYAEPLVLVLEIPAPSKTWTWDTFLKVAEKRRRGHGATVYWTRASVIREFSDDEQYLLRNVVDLDAA